MFNSEKSHFQFIQTKNGYLIYTWLEKTLKGTLVNQTSPSLNRESLEITLIAANSSLQQLVAANSSSQQLTAAHSSLQQLTSAYSSLHHRTAAYSSLHQLTAAYNSLQQPPSTRKVMFESYDFLSICWTPRISGETYWYLCINIPGTAHYRMDSTLLENNKVEK